MKYYFLIICFCITAAAAAQKPAVARISAVYDTNAVAELYNRAAIGLIIHYSDSSTRRTEGLLKGNYRWNQLQVSCPAGDIRQGVLTFDRKALAQLDYQLPLQVQLPEGSFATTLALPRLTGIRFNHYADSLKRGIHFYLNVEGRFSSGKIFPLDTGMIRFTSSAGKMIGQDLLLEQTDSTVTQITVEAVNKYRPGMHISSVIPVKQKPDDDSMILKDTKDLFRKKKRP